MQDPFADKSNQNYHREIQMWMAVLMCLLVAFLYLAIKRMTGSHEEFPDHILQSSVAQVTPPIGYDAAQALPPKPLLSSVPPIKKAAFPVNRSLSSPNLTTKTNPSSKPGFEFPARPLPVRRLPANRFAAIPAKSFEPSQPNESAKPATPAKMVGFSKPPERSAFPDPSFVQHSFVAPRKVESVAADAEAIGRRRAKQLAEITSGLPERLNRLQSSVKQATVVLPLATEAEAEKNSPKFAANSFVPMSPLKAAVESPRSPVGQLPKVLASQATFEAVKPIQPAVENTFTINPIDDSPALVAVRNVVEEDPVLELQNEPRNESQKEPQNGNGFLPVQSLPVQSLRQIVEPEVSEFVFDAVRIPKVLQRQTKPMELAKLSKTIPSPDLDLKQHVVQAGDSFFTIAQQHYGDAQWFRALRLANQAIVSGGELPVGATLSIPTTVQLAEQFPAYAVQAVGDQPTEAQERIYVTQAGDTLFDIARRKTGQGSRFSEIIRTNDFRLPKEIRASDQLPEGLRLVLPKTTLQ